MALAGDRTNPEVLDGQLSINNLRLHYRHWHPKAQDTPIVCFHGWLDNAASFDHIIPLFDKHPCYAFDLPGHGLSDHYPPQAHYHFIDSVQLALSLIKSLPYPEVILMGHSMGGAIASLAAANLCSQIKAVLLLDALGPLSDEPEHARLNLLAYCQGVEQLANKSIRIYQSIDEACEQRAKAGYISASDVKGIIRRGMRHNGLGYIWRHDRRLTLRPSLMMIETQVTSFLSQINVPVCLISATRGFEREKARFQGRTSLVPTLTSHLLASGHHLHIEQPRACAQHFHQYLAQIG